MSGSIRSASVLLVAAFLIMAASGALLTLIAVRLDAQVSELVIGAVSAAYFAGLTAGSLFAFHLIVRIGHIRAFTTFATVISASVLVYALGGDIALWGVCRFIDGFCMAGLFICMESWLNDRATPQTRGRLLALYMIAVYSGQAAGQALLSVPDAGGFVVFILVSLLFSAAVLPVALTRMTPPALPDISALGIRRLFAASPLGILGAITSGIVLGSLFSLGPVYASAQGLALSQTALFMGLAILGGVALQWPTGRLSDRIDRRRVILGVLAAIAAASLAMLAVQPTGAAALMVSGMAFGGVSFALYPLSVALTNDHLPPRDRVSGSGGLVLSYSAGATIGPLIASSAMAAMGSNGLFAVTALIPVLVFAFGLSALARQTAPAAHSPQDWQGQAPTTPASSSLEALEGTDVPSLPTVETLPQGEFEPT